MLDETRIGESVKKTVYKHPPNVEKTDAAQSFYFLEERYSLRKIVSEHERNPIHVDSVTLKIVLRQR